MGWMWAAVVVFAPATEVGGWEDGSIDSAVCTEFDVMMSNNGS